MRTIVLLLGLCTLLASVGFGETPPRAAPHASAAKPLTAISEADEAGKTLSQRFTAFNEAKLLLAIVYGRDLDNALDDASCQEVIDAFVSKAAAEQERRREMLKQQGQRAELPPVPVSGTPEEKAEFYLQLLYELHNATHRADQYERVMLERKSQIDQRLPPPKRGTETNTPSSSAK